MQKSIQSTMTSLYLFLVKTSTQSTTVVVTKCGKVWSLILYPSDIAFLSNIIFYLELKDCVCCLLEWVRSRRHSHNSPQFLRTFFLRMLRAAGTSARSGFSRLQIRATIFKNVKIVLKKFKFV